MNNWQRGVLVAGSTAFVVVGIVWLCTESDKHLEWVDGRNPMDLVVWWAMVAVPTIVLFFAAKTRKATPDPK